MALPVKESKQIQLPKSNEKIGKSWENWLWNRHLGKKNTPNLCNHSRTWPARSAFQS
jgi:hypothetical protein